MHILHIIALGLGILAAIPLVALIVFIVGMATAYARGENPFE
jgi:hypothetical protein